MGGQIILIDTGPEFRLQALRSGLQRVDGVLITHTHADHVAGFDDLRAFNFITGEPVQVFGSLETVKTLKHNYPYIFGEAIQVGGGLPHIKVKEIKGPFILNGIKITPIPVKHGKVEVYGYRFGKMAYVTDLSYLSKEAIALLEGLDLLVLGVLRYRRHSTHLCLEDALSLVDKLQPKRTYFTHISHDIEHKRVSQRLPQGIYLAYDGLKLEFLE